MNTVQKFPVYILTTNTVQSTTTTVSTMTMSVSMTTSTIRVNVNRANVNIGPMVVTVTITASTSTTLTVEVERVDNMVVMVSMWIAVMSKWSKKDMFEIINSLLLYP